MKRTLVLLALLATAILLCLGIARAQQIKIQANTNASYLPSKVKATEFIVADTTAQRKSATTDHSNVPWQSSTTAVQPPPAQEKKPYQFPKCSELPPPPKDKDIWVSHTPCLKDSDAERDTRIAALEKRVAEQDARIKKLEADAKPHFQLLGGAN